MILRCAVETAMGWVGLAAGDGKLLRSTLPARTRSEALEAVSRGLPEACDSDEIAFGDLPSRLRRYFLGERVSFADVELNLEGYGRFHSTVLLAALKIPHGTTVTYGWLARTAGSDNAARAAGTAMARNRFPVVVPCHRVVASGGKLGGFSGGVHWKIALLRLEGVPL